MLSFYLIMFLICSFGQYCNAVSSKFYKKCFKTVQDQNQMDFSDVVHLVMYFSKYYFDILITVSKWTWHPLPHYYPPSANPTARHPWLGLQIHLPRRTVPSPARPAASTTSLQELSRFQKNNPPKIVISLHNLASACTSPRD